MKGDFSRNSFRPAKHYNGVRQQQGRVQLDADWNEQVDIRTHLARTHRRDVIGLAGVPHSDGNFRISVRGYPDDFIIDPGRIYVDGILCELEESPIPINEFYDNQVIQVAAAKDEPSLQAGEQVQLTAGGGTTAMECRIDSVDDGNRVTLYQDVSALSGGSNPTLRRRTTYRHQPDYQVPSDGPAAGNTYLVYLDVWERHVTAIEDPAIREVALGGPDTATRTKTVWQVKLVNLEDSDELESLGLSEIDKWDANARPDRGMLTARCQAPQSTDQVYSLTSGGGYQGPENQLYRVEIHAGGKLGNGSANRPTFKWSRDNGSVVTRWLAQDKDLLTVESTGLDENFKFAKGQWIELTDDTLDLQGRRGVFSQIKEVADQTIIIDPVTKDDPDGVISGDESWYDYFGPHRKIRRWDFTALADMAIPAVDSANGDGWITLENGIEVKFEPGSYRTGDYWLIPARRSKANIIWPADENDNPRPQPPAGIEHHYAPLAKLDYEKNNATGEYRVIRDYRRVFPTLTDINKLRYISGDGQEAMPGDELPQALRVGVFIGRQPLEGAKIRFEIVGGGGILREVAEANSQVGTALTLSTDSSGIVPCNWELPSYFDVTDEEQKAQQRKELQVKATLVDDQDEPMDDISVFFSASFSLAEQVAYEPRGRGAGSDSQMGGADTVQKGLDRLDKIKVNTQGKDKMEGPLTIAKTLTIGKGLTVGSGGDKWEGGKPNTTLHGGLKVAGGAKDDYRDLLVEGSAMIKEDLIIKGNIIVKGDKFAKDLDHVAGSMLLGNEPNDSIEFFGRLSSASDQPALLVDDTLHVIDDVIVDGNMGIGTPSPGAKLDVAGRTFRLGSAVYQDESLSGEAIISSDGVHTDLIPAQDDVGAVRVRDGNSPGALTVTNAGISEINSYADVNTPSSLVLQTNGGNVGIGTQSPGAKLDVAGRTFRLGSAVYQDESLSGEAIISSDGVHTDLIPAQDDVGAVRVRDGNSPGALTVTNAGNSEINSYADTEADTPSSLVLQTNGGNVGIGVPSPNEQLHVVGNCIIDGNLQINGETAGINTALLEAKASVIQVNGRGTEAPTAGPQGQAGLAVHRGTEDAARIVWDEAEDCWKIGGEGDLKEVATVDQLPSGVARTIYQQTHDFEVGDAIYFDAATASYAKATASDSAKTGLFLVSETGVDPDAAADHDRYFTLVQAGYVEGLSGLTPGEYYYVSDDPAQAGSLTPVEPLSISNPILLADSEHSGYVLPYRPSEPIQQYLQPLKVLGVDRNAPPRSIYVDAGGNVGIETIYPEARFHVHGDATFDNVLIGGNLALSGNGADATWLENGNPNGHLALRIAGNEKVRIASNGYVGIGTAEPDAALHVIGDLLGAAKDEAGNALRICCGQTLEGNTNWQPYGAGGTYVDVDTSSGGFQSTPLYIVNMHGNSNNWSTTGGDSAYSRTPTGFRVYVRFSDGRALTPADANGRGWHIQWMAIGK